MTEFDNVRTSNIVRLDSLERFATFRSNLFLVRKRNSRCSFEMLFGVVAWMKSHGAVGCSLIRLGLKGGENAERSSSSF